MVSRQLVYVTGMLEVIFGPFRPLGAAQNGWRSFPRPRKSSKQVAEAFRGLGNRQNEPLKLSEGSEIVKTSR